MFKAPTGVELEGIVQEAAKDVWVPVFDEDSPDTPDVVDWGCGPGAVDWQSVDIEGACLYSDVEHDAWLEHHLIPEGKDPLSAETVALMREEVLIGLALNAARCLTVCVTDIPPRNPVQAHIDTGEIEALLEHAYAAAKEVAANARATEMA